MLTVKVKDLVERLKWFRQVQGREKRVLSQSVLLAAKADRLMLAGTIRKRLLETELPGTGEDSFSAAVSFPELLAKLLNLKGEVQLAVRDGELILHGLEFGLESSVPLLNVENEEACPALPDWESGKAVAEVSTDDLLRALRRTVPFTEIDQNEYPLSGILLSVEHGRLNLVASDRYRLSIAELPTSASAEGEIGILPGAAAVVLEQICLRQAGIVIFSRKGEDELLISAPQGRMQVKFVEGKFPNFRHVVPPLGQAHLHIHDREGFFAALSALSCGGDRMRRVQLRRGEGRKVRLSTQGSTLETATADNFGMLALDFDRNYLVSALASASGRELTLHFSANTNRTLSFREEGYYHLLATIEPAGGAKVCPVCGKLENPEVGDCFCSVECRRLLEKELGKDWLAPVEQLAA